MFDDFWPFQHLEMAVPVTELIPQQLGYFERGSAHTLELRSIYPLKDNRRRAVEKELVYIVYSCYTGLKYFVATYACGANYPYQALKGGLFCICVESCERS